METGFTGKDLEIMKSLKFDPSLKPNFESLKGCLVWKDERPRGLSLDADDLVNSLLIARASIHRGLTLDDLPFDPEYYKELWALAQQQISEWPGFKRLTLSDEDRLYLEDEIAASFREDL